MTYDRRYCGRGPARTDLYGRSCRVVTTWRRNGPRNVLIEFADGGQRVVCPIRTIRKATVK